MGDKKYLSNGFSTINNIILKNDNLRKIKSIYYYIDWILLRFIKKPKKQTGSKKNIIISFNLILGDGVIFITALKNLRKIYPKEKYHITFACQKGLQTMYEKLEIFDEVIPLNFTKATVNLKERFNIFKKLRKNYYDIALDPIAIEECSMNILVNRAICADKKIGLINNDRKVYCPHRIYNKVYNEIIQIKGKHIHCIEQYNEFFNGLTENKSNVEFVKLPSEEVKEKLPNEYFIIYPSASTEYKRWPIERFARYCKKNV